MSKVEQMEGELRKLSQAELRQIREWLDALIEDDLEFTPEFERSITQAERDMAAGKPDRSHEAEGACALPPTSPTPASTPSSFPAPHHPIIQTCQPGEDCLWCDVGEVSPEPAQ